MSAETAPQLKISWLIGTAAALALFAVIAIYSSSMARHYTDYDQQRAQDRLAKLKTMQADAVKTLNAPADWVDRNKGTIHIPIDEAMTKEVEALKSQPAQVGAAIPGPAPAKPAPAAPASAPAAGTTPAATPAPAAAAKPNK